MVAALVAFTYSIFSFSFWSVYNYRMDKVGEGTEHASFAVMDTDSGDSFGKAQFTETGCDGFVQIQAPDGWNIVEDFKDENAVAFEKSGAMIVFSGYSVPQDKDASLAMIDEMMDASAQSTRQDASDNGWYTYLRSDNSEFKTGTEQYYVHVDGDSAVSHVTVVSAYIPNKLSGSDIIGSFVAEDSAA